jgi:hypothetical protein
VKEDVANNSSYHQVTARATNKKYDIDLDYI